MPEPAYVSDHAAAREEIGALAWLLAEVVRVADDADGMSADQMRAEIRRVADTARGKASVQCARGVNGDG
ncbi:MAG: hypothetical protein ACRDSN_01120 [Pseudonocardiaceae bacterium]